MASIEVISGTPLAEALQNVIQPKLAEQGWSSGAGDDSALSEYIVLMLSSNKTQEQIAAELATDLLQLQADDPSALDFTRWLFDQVQVLNAKLNGAPAPQEQMETSQISAVEPTDMEGVSQDATMSDGTDGVAGVPTGPKSMRNGQGPQRGGRGGRMLGQMRNAMERSDQSLHRIKGAAGQGRINQHSREPPRGPKNMANRMQNMMGGRQSMNPQVAQGMANGVSQQQQMALLQMLEEQSRMMAQILGPGGAPQPAINPAFFNNQKGGKSLFERVDRPKQNGHFKKQHQKPSGDNMETDATSAEGDEANKDQSLIPCRFQLSCTSPTCPYAHQSPAAPPGISIDASDKCSFGPACQNKKCTGSHPSPSQRRQHLGSTVDCKFYPNCTNPSCPFRHPATPPCRNGADCPEKDTGCKYSHSTIACRYNPCLNPRCPFTHTEGQKRGKFEDKVWTSGEGEGFDREAAEKDSHVSERRFVTEAEEELIIPGQSAEQGNEVNMENDVVA